jgi:uncharacterized protein (TIGR03437 family)
LTSVPSTVAQNPAVDASCQWSQQLIVQEQLGFAVTLTRLKAGSADWTNQIQRLFGTNRLAPLGMLQAQICWPGPTVPPTTAFEVDGVDQGGSPVTAIFSTSFSGPTQNPGTLSAASDAVTLSQATPSANLNVSLTGGGSATVSVLPANRSTTWLTVNGTPPQITVKASLTGLMPGVYNATVLIQSQSAKPAFVEVPVVLAVGSAGVAIGGVSTGASFQQAFAPGMILSVFGSQLAPSVQLASSVPLPFSLAGVSATVNGVTAPLYFVSPGQINLQVPYETGAGTAVLGINNGGAVGSFTFPVSPVGPGVFTDPTHAGSLLPTASARHGDTILAFITGDGLVSTSLATGASPFQATPLDLLPAPMLPVSVTVGGVAAKVAFAGIPAGLVGATQINFVIPDSAPSGVQPVVVTVGGIASQPATVTIQ